MTPLSPGSRPAPVRRLASVGALALALSGCGGATPLTFDLAALPAPARTGAATRTIVVAEPVGLQTLEADRIIVREPSGALSFLGGGQWADRLPRLIQARIIQSLENSGRLRSVSRPGDKVVAAYQLVSEIRTFDIDARTGEAVADISAKIVAEGTGRVVDARIFTARVPVPRIDPGSAGAGLDAALTRVLTDLVRWVNQGR